MIFLPQLYIVCKLPKLCFKKTCFFKSLYSVIFQAQFIFLPLFYCSPGFDLLISYFPFLSDFVLLTYCELQMWELVNCYACESGGKVQWAQNFDQLYIIWMGWYTLGNSVLYQDTLIQLWYLLNCQISVIILVCFSFFGHILQLAGS